jgi:hypothetical protein
MEVLTAFIREHSREQGPAGPGGQATQTQRIRIAYMQMYFAIYEMKDWY